MKVAVITGAAKGLGQAIAKALKENPNEKWFVISVDRNPPTHKYADRFIISDLLVEDQMGHIIEYAADIADNELGERRIDLLVNNAGMTNIQWAEKYDPEVFRNVMELNVTVPFLLTQQYLKQKFENRCCVVNIASMGARYALRASAPYCASKSGLVAMTKQLARECADRHPQFVFYAVSPNSLEGTGMTDYCIDSLVNVRGFKDREAAEKYFCQSPLGRLNTLEEVAETVRWLAEQGPRYMSGANLEHIGGAA